MDPPPFQPFETPATPFQYSVWTNNDLRDQNLPVAELLDILKPKILASSARTIDELRFELNECIEQGKLELAHRAKDNPPNNTLLMNMLKIITMAQAFRRYVTKKEAIAARQINAHHKMSDEEVQFSVQHIPANEDPKPHVLKRVDEFAKLSTWAKGHIARLTGALITDLTIQKSTLGHSRGLHTYIILMHGHSTLFRQVAEETIKTLSIVGNEAARIYFICTEEGPQDIRQLRNSISLANELGIPPTHRYPDSYTSIMQVNMVIIEADIVDSEGSIISAIGTYQIVKAAENENIPVCVLAEGHKLSKATYGNPILNRDRTPKHLKRIIVTNGGAINNSDVSAELEKQYEHLISA